MRLLFNALSLRNRPSGTRTRLEGLVPALLRQGDWDLTILHAEGVEFPGLKGWGGDLSFLPRRRPSGRFSRGRREARIIAEIGREHPFDFVFSDCLPLPRVPSLVATIHDLRHREGSSFSSAAFQTLLARGLRAAARVHAVSETVAGELRSFVPGCEVQVVPNGVDLERFAPGPVEGDEEVLARLELKTPYLLSVGHFEERKDFDLVLKLRAELLRRQIDLDAVLVGAGEGLPERGFATLLAASGGRPCGSVLRGVDDRDLPALLRQAWAFIAPARLEGFGLAPLEALACGSCVIASAIPAHREVLGQAALFAAPGDCDAFLRQVLDLRHDGALRFGMRRKALERAALFTWDEAARRLRASLLG